MLSKGKEIMTEKGKNKLNYSNASSGLQKRINSDGVLRFLDISANVADGESDSSSSDSFIDDHNDFVEDQIHSTAIVKLETETDINLPFIQNVEDMSMEEFERMVLERYKPGSSLITYAEDESLELIDQNIEIPLLENTSASKVPIVWRVKCTVGREKHSAVCLMHKFVELQNMGKMLQIVSAFAVENVKGFLYIEAYKQCDVYEACNGICSTNPRGMVPVPEKELSRLFRVRIGSSNIITGTWIRLKKGKYKGDLAQVVAVNGSRKKATLKLIPRIDLQAVTQKLLGGVSDKKTFVPAQKLISSSELEEFRPLIRNRRDRDTDEVFEILDGMMLKDGYLYKKVSLDSISCCVVHPSQDDLLKFENSTNEDPSDQEWLSELFGEREKRLLIKGDIFSTEREDSSSISTEDVSKVHDMVFFREKEFGYIISIENDDGCKVLTESSEGQSVVDLKLCETKKLICDKKFTAWDHQHNIISTNSRVYVVEGPLQGRVGIVKHIYRGIVFVYDKTDLENGGYFCCKSQDCKKIKISGLSSKDKGGELVPLGTDDVSSSSKSPFLPAKSTKESINSWESQNCKITEVSGVPIKSKGGEVEGLGTDDLHSPSKPPLSTKQAPKENTDNRKYYLGGKDVIFTIGQSLKIRMGPLKGYCCQIMALSNSEVMVKLDSQPNTIAVKPEHLLGVHERNSAKPSGLAGGRKCLRGKEKIQRISDAGRNAATSFSSEEWSKNWNKGKASVKQVDRPQNKQRSEVFWSKQTEISVKHEGDERKGILERTKTFVRGSSSGGRTGRGGGRGEFGRGRGVGQGGRGESQRGRGGGKSESERGRGGRGGGRRVSERGRGGRGGGRSESERGRGARSGRSEFGRGRGGGRSEFGRGRGRGGGRGEFERGRGGGQSESGRGRGVDLAGKALIGRGLGGKEQFHTGQGNGHGSINHFNTGGGNGLFNMGRGDGQSNMGQGKQQFNMGQGRGRGSMDQLNMGRGNGRGGNMGQGTKDQFDMGRGRKDQLNEGWGHEQGGKEHFEMRRGGKEYFCTGRGNGQGGKEHFSTGRGNGQGGTNPFNMGRGNGQGGANQFNMGLVNTGGRIGRGGTRGGRGQFGRGTSCGRGESSGWKGDDRQKQWANSNMQMGSPSNRNVSQAGATGWQTAAGNTGNQMRSRFSGASNAGMQGNAETVGRKRGAEMMGDQTKSWGYKKWKQ